MDRESDEATKRRRDGGRGTVGLPLLEQRHSGHQRAFLKIQDGCDAHCTYCIIPNLRTTLWSKGVGEVVEEARRLVGAGHREIVLTGIFLGAYRQNTALHRRQDGQVSKPLADILRALCRDVSGLKRVRLSSLEPGDVTGELIEVMRDLEQVVPHFHLPLQSGSEKILRRMNRQYSRGDYLRMVEEIHEAFDRPAITTDVIVGFPGETDDEFERTVEVVEAARFIHVHAFSFSPRPGTAAARWTEDFVRGPVVNERIEILNELARKNSFRYREQFVGEIAELLVEVPGEETAGASTLGFDRSDRFVEHGRCERYFPVCFESEKRLTGKSVKVRVDRVTREHTAGTLVEVQG